MLKIQDLIDVVKGEVVCGAHRLCDEVEYAFASDLMSDVLTLQVNNILLFTGLANIQTIRTAEMADISFILLARNKKASKEILALARETNQVIIECKYSMFKTCGLLYKAGLKPVY